MPVIRSLNSFARLETLVSRHCMAHLSNASATWWLGAMGESDPVPGVRVTFDRESSEFAGDAVNAANPVASVYEADVPGIGRNSVLQIVRDGETVAHTFRVIKASPDGTGWVELQLQELDL